MRVGDVVVDRFEIFALAGSGGMGAVWRARDRLGGEVALKILHQSSDAERLRREAVALAEVRGAGSRAPRARGGDPALPRRRRRARRAAREGLPPPRGSFLEVRERTLARAKEWGASE